METSDAPVTTVERDAARLARAGVWIMGEQEVKASTNLSRVTRWRLERDGKFPPRVQLTGNRVGWLAEEIVQWITSRPRAAGTSCPATPPDRAKEDAEAVPA